MKHILHTFSFAVALATPAIAQVADWTEVTTANSPSAREGLAMTYDSARGKTVIFGGGSIVAGNFNSFNDTWEFDGVNWTQVSTTNSPSPRFLHAMTYDSARGKVVMLGGGSNGTWEYDGANWTQITTANSPILRESHAMTYDSLRGKVVVFGGQANSGFNGLLNDTWEYDGVNWTQVTTTNSPAARYRHEMTYDSARGKVVMFGGEDDFFNRQINDTWEYDGVNWTQIAPTSSPSARANHQMTYDSARGKVVIFGGGNNLAGTFNTLDDTWEYDGISWTQVTSTSSPSSRTNHEMTYDIMRGKLVTFGGFNGTISSGFNYLNDTWEYGVVPECYLFLGIQEGAVALGPQIDDVIRVLPLEILPVTTTQIPSLWIPNIPGLIGSNVSAQVAMYNPIFAPTNPLQFSNGLRLTIGVGTQSFGQNAGIVLGGNPTPWIGQNYSFWFTITP